MENSMEIPQNTKIQPPKYPAKYPAILLPGIYRKKMKSLHQIETI
jgi:hypothetical protein